MFAGNVSKCLDEDWVAVQALCALDAGAVGFVDNLQVQFVQGFDVITRKRNRDQNQVRLSLLHVLLHGITCLGSEPGRGADLRLPAQAIRVAEVESLHDSMNCRGNLSGIRVT